MLKSKLQNAGDERLIKFLKYVKTKPYCQEINVILYEKETRMTENVKYLFFYPWEPSEKHGTLTDDPFPMMCQK